MILNRMNKMTKEEAIKYLQQLYPNGGNCWLDEQRIEAIGMAVKSLQEEPASEDLAVVVREQMEYDGDVDDFVRRGIDDIALKLHLAHNGIMSR